MRSSLVFVLCVWVGSVSAGAQQEQELADQVRTVLSAKVARDASGLHAEAQFDSVTEKVQWLARMASLLPRKWKPTYQQRVEFLNLVHYEATRAGLEPELVLGLIQVESNFRRYAISSAGARGYMQVMPFWVDNIGNGDRSALFDMRTNLRFGCTILRHYIDIEQGNLFRALGRYNGSLGRSKYPNKVLKAWRRWSDVKLPGS
ncbi:MAG: lytic transglycosylase domain-containing protein [Burkholderiaceae bacterium]